MFKSKDVCIPISKSGVLPAVTLAMSMNMEGKYMEIIGFDEDGGEYNLVEVYKAGNLNLDDYERFTMVANTERPVFITEHESEGFAIPAKFGLMERVYGIIPVFLSDNRFKVAELVVVKVIASTGLFDGANIQNNELFKNHPQIGCSSDANIRIFGDKVFNNYEYYCVEADKWEKSTYFRIYKKNECELYKKKEDLLL